MEHLGPDVPLHFTAFHPDWKMPDTPPTPPADAAHRRGASRWHTGLRYVYTGNIHDPAGQTTYCHWLRRRPDRPRRLRHHRVGRLRRRRLRRLRHALPGRVRRGARPLGPAPAAGGGASRGELKVVLPPAGSDKKKATRVQMQDKVTELSRGECRNWVVNAIGAPTQIAPKADKELLKPLPERAVWIAPGVPKTDASMFSRVSQQ